MFHRLSELCPKLCEIEVGGNIGVSNQGRLPEATEGDRYSKKQFPPLGNHPCLTRSLVDRMLFLDEFSDPRRLAQDILRKVGKFRQLQT